MLKANELRIGNLINWGVNIVPIRSIHTESVLKDNVSVYIELNEKLQNYCLNITDIEPILLTEEWLLNFGFERHHADYSNDVIYIKNVPNNNEFIWGVYPFELGSGFVINKSKSLKYVHQLQNLYFALTGEELNIK